MTTLVTGGTGFVGSAVIRQLIEGGISVRALSRPESDRRNLEGLDLEIVEGDLLDPLSLRKAVSGCSSLYHVAADYRLWVPQPERIYQVNVEGTVDLMREAVDAGVGRIVYTSSVATLGLNRDGSPAHEDTPVSEADMIGHYKKSKFLAEKEVRTLIEEEALPIVVVNPSTPLGPRDIKPTPTGRMIQQAVAGNIPAFVDTGLNLVHVDDVARGHLLAFERGQVGERYILGGENFTLGEILAVVADLLGRKPPRTRIPHSLVLPVAWLAEGWARLTHGAEPFVTRDGVRMARKKMFFSSEKAVQKLGYEYRPARTAIQAAVEWFSGK